MLIKTEKRAFECLVEVQMAFLDSAWGGRTWLSPHTMPHKMRSSRGYGDAFLLIGLDNLVAITKLAMDIGISLESLYHPGGAIYEAATATRDPTQGSYRLGQDAIQRLENHQRDILVQELSSKARISSYQAETVLFRGLNFRWLHSAFPEATLEDAYDAACVSELATLSDESSCPGTPTTEEMCATPFDGSTRSSSAFSEQIESLLSHKLSGCASSNTTTTPPATEKDHWKATSTVETIKSSPRLPASWPDVEDEVQENKSKLEDKQQLLAHSDQLRRPSNDPRPEPESIMTLISDLILVFLTTCLIIGLLVTAFTLYMLASLG
ncbi:hypothetical protein FALBO_9127 [Fusarium albosuccineum]|uniref:Uncharacterized protein n=1 Tax=Fusarium albosuccineum TaxID=1237068 RepID=A0A8H4L705_9HYPO|nr:hypothetical protein FALBO_9127 [Fusarium albosuccineum]